MNISDRLLNSVTRRPQTSVNGDGDPVLGVAQVLNARVEQVAQRVRRGKDGVVSESTTSVWTDVEVKDTDRLWLNGDDSNDVGKGRVPIAVEGIPDLDGLVEFWRTYL